MTDITVPSLGESVTEATIAKWLKSEGDPVEADETIAELETDKVTLEVNAPEDGILTDIIVGEGESVEVGALIARLKAGKEGSQRPAQKETETKQDRSEPDTTQPDGQDNEQGNEHNKAEKRSTAEHGPPLSPSVRKLVAEHDISPSEVRGTGKDGRILKEDVKAYLEMRQDHQEDSSAQAAHDVVGTHPVTEETSRHRERSEERVRMTRLRQRIAERLKEAQDTAAMLTTFNEADMSAMMSVRERYKESFEKRHGVRLGFMSFFVKAAVRALQDFPSVNARIDGQDIVYQNFYDVGVAVSTPQGLVVPVVRDADHKSMAELEREILDYGTRAREGAIALEDMTGGTFTITNGGVFGSLMSTPILNTPQAAILGMHKVQKRPVVTEDGSIQARPMMYLALSYDHRLIDGREAVSFLVRIKDAIEDPQRLLLDV